MQHSILAYVRPESQSADPSPVSLADERRYWREQYQPAVRLDEERGCFCFTSTRTPVRGLTRVLQQRQAVSMPGERARFNRQSRVHGLRVHRQLAHLVQCTAQSCQCLVRTHVNRLCLDTERLLLTLHDFRLQPVASEVPLYCREAHLATAADLLARGPDGRLTLVSIKTGGGVHSRHWRTPLSSRLAPPFAGALDASERSLHQAQLCVERLLVQQVLETRAQEPCEVNGLILYSVPVASRSKKRNKEQEPQKRKQTSLDSGGETKKKRRKKQTEKEKETTQLLPLGLELLRDWDQKAARRRVARAPGTCLVEPLDPGVRRLTADDVLSVLRHKVQGSNKERESGTVRTRDPQT